VLFVVCFPLLQQTYTDKLNAALFTLRERGGAAKELAKRGVDAILTRLDEVPEDLRTALRNNGGGYVNHDLYWRSLSPPALSVPRESATLDSLVARPGPSADSLLGQAIARDFGSFDAFKKQFSDMSLPVFGSGWVWLYVHVEPSASGASALGSLRLQATANQDNPRILDQNDRHVLLLTIDLWEHAYYVDYYNKRAKFVEAFWSVIDWQRAEQEYSKHAEAAAAKETGHEAKTEL